VGNDLVVFGGFINDFADVTNRTYALDVSVDGSTWRRMDDIPLTVGITHAAVAAVGTTIYLCGGYSTYPGPHISTCLVYDHSTAPGNGQWSQIANLPQGGSAAGGMIYDTVQNALYYSGGRQSFTTGNVLTVDVSNTWKFSLTNRAVGWVRATPIPYHANHLSSVTHTNALGQERHYFMGGQSLLNEAKGNVADNFEFIAHSETWIRRASMPLARGHTTASTRAVGCGIIVAGGSLNSSTNGKNRTSIVSYYDVAMDRWTTSIGNIPAPGATPIVDIDQNGYIHFMNTHRNSARRSITL
jgi:Kelch motif